MFLYYEWKNTSFYWKEIVNTWYLLKWSEYEGDWYFERNEDE